MTPRDSRGMAVQNGRAIVVLCARGQTGELNVLGFAQGAGHHGLGGIHCGIGGSKRVCSDPDVCIYILLGIYTGSEEWKRVLNYTAAEGRESGGGVRRGSDGGDRSVTLFDRPLIGFIHSFSDNCLKGTIV